ncbi:hypothetical protein NKI54_03285 [Mesorhizobium sp. M0663]|uniref:hypothetical protein n=1 Tax=Mesorhizobium sp. M0663 TaxID=2956981 RepID=UPI00333D88EE
MPTITHVFTIDHVSQMIGEDLELLQAIVSNDDNLSSGSIISVHDSTEKAITALTDDGIDELTQMLTHARRSAEKWSDFLDDFVSDPDSIARIKARSSA